MPMSMLKKQIEQHPYPLLFAAISWVPCPRLGVGMDCASGHATCPRRAVGMAPSDL
jgi:hypothetical protein